MLKNPLVAGGLVALVTLLVVEAVGARKGAASPFRRLASMIPGVIPKGAA